LSFSAVLFAGGMYHIYWFYIYKKGQRVTSDQSNNILILKIKVWLVLLCGLLLSHPMYLNPVSNPHLLVLILAWLIVSRRLLRLMVLALSSEASVLQC
jgi:cbb3-type cytochrome oxidase subunit 3